jgi:hypothetical protein
VAADDLAETPDTAVAGSTDEHRLGDEDESPSPDPATPANFPLDEDPPWANSTDGGTTRALSQFLTISPCLDLYQRSGSNHRWLFALCFALDLVIRLGATILIITILGAVAWKTLAPLPDLWDTGS